MVRRALQRGGLVAVLAGLVLCTTPGVSIAQGVVRGIVRWSDGTRASGVGVEIVPLPPAITNDTGGYVMPAIPPGTSYTVRAEGLGGVWDSATAVVVTNGGTTVVDLWLGDRPADWTLLADSVPLGTTAQPGLVLLYLDSLAVTMEDVSDSGRARTRDSVEARGLVFAGDSSGVMVFGVPAPLLGDTLAFRDSAFIRAARVRRDLAGIVRQAGPLARLGAAGSPLVATNEVVVELATGMSDTQVRSLATAVRATLPWRVPVGPARYLMRAWDYDGPALANRLMGLGVGGPVQVAHVHFRARTSAEAATGSPQPGDQWHLGAVNVAGAEARILASGLPPGSPLIAILEGGGIDVNHPAFATGLSGWNFQACDEDPPPWPTNAPPPAIPPCGGTATGSNVFTARHGPPVAALAAASGPTSAVKGVCTGCSLLPVVYAGDSPTQAGWAVEWAQVKKADVISWSWVIELSVAEIQLEAPGLVSAVLVASAAVPLVIGAPNESGVDPCQAQWLQSISGVIVVGVSNHRDYGIPAGEGSCISVIAPGGRGGFLGIFPPTGRSDMTGIVTADLPGAVGYNPGCPSGDYADLAYTSCFGGTSAATPIVAGVLGLMKQANPTLAAGVAKSNLENSTDKIDKLRAGYDNTGHSPTHGYGRVNACAAVEMTLGAPPSDCRVDLRPWWLKWLVVLAVLLVVTAFIVAGIFCGWCHWLTIVLATLAAFVVTFVALYCFVRKMDSRARVWIALGVAVVVLVIYLIICR